MRATRSRADAAGRAARWAGAGGAGWAERLIGPSALGRAGVTGWAAGKKEPLGFAGGSKLGRGEVVWAAGVGRGKERWAGVLRWNERGGPAGLLTGLGWFSGLGFFSSSIFFPFLTQTKLKLFLNSNPYAIKQNKTCTSMNATTKFKLRQILITCERKINLNTSLSI